MKSKMSKSVHDRSPSTNLSRTLWLLLLATRLLCSRNSYLMRGKNRRPIQKIAKSWHEGIISKWNSTYTVDKLCKMDGKFSVILVVRRHDQGKFFK